MPKPTPGKQYTIVKENTLSQVASRAYGNANHWPVIYRANQSTLRSGDPNLIYPGEVIFIPELAGLLRVDPGINNRLPDELSIVIDGLEIRSTASRVLLTMDTASDGWTASLPWEPGANPELDKRVLPGAFPPAKVYIGGKLVISGYLYRPVTGLDMAGTVKNLHGFSRTADLIDSNFKEPYEESNVTLRQRADKLVAPFGIKVVYELDTVADINDPFDRVTASPTDKVFAHLNKLAKQRGVLISSTADGNLLFTAADTKSPPITTIQEGEPLAGRFTMDYDGRKRFSTTTAYGSTPGGNAKEAVQDPGVPRGRMKNFQIGDVLYGELEAAAKWERNRSLADAMTIPIPVATWLNPEGEIWKPNTKITVISASIHVPKGFDFLVRSVEFNENGNEKSAILNVIPPQVYTKEDIIEPWH